FDPARTVQIAGEIGPINAELVRQKRKYLLIGPGRWGSADRWLGVPVDWKDISGVAGIIETSTENLNAEPSQGSHFFHNITSLGLGYMSIPRGGEGFMDYRWLQSLPPEKETVHLRHVRLDASLIMKIDGKTSRGVLLKK
ncbi:MAG: phosphoenolpyruvate synthase/pyruvate phosphate dikinase, partial [Desulfobacterales bacterium]|nr:phosphoenolpyruvate synthase/pyruvate phosphate dikinase [Desulfobacterales bacterium]